MPGPARFYAATLAVLLVAVALFAFARSQEKPQAVAPTTAPGALSPLQQALQGIRDDGTWSKETALAVFAAAFGPLPGVPVPPVDRSYHSGSLAIQMVSATWSELTDAQRQAIRDYIGPPAPEIVPAAYRSVLFDAYQTLADQAAADIASHLGRPLGIPIKIFLSPTEGGPTDWAWASGQWAPNPPAPLPSHCIVSIPPSTVNDPSRAPYMRWIFLHEVFHCYQHSLVDRKTAINMPPWVVEGEADWVAEAITGGSGHPPPMDVYWNNYVHTPGKKLYARAYDAVGFYAQLAQTAIDPWGILDATYKAGGGGSDAAFQASGANTATFTDRWASSWYRDGQSNAAWAMHDGFGISPTSDRAIPGSIALADGGSDSISAKPLTATISDLHTTAFVTRVEVPAGTGRVGEPRAAGLDKVVRGATLDLCTNPGGDCTCPSGSGLTETPPQTAPPDLRLAATGEQNTESLMQLRGISKDEWCKPKPTPSATANPCGQGCGGSNGDPHMRTIDGARYDLQSAGEYVLLRSADGSVEIQGRQERPTTGQNVTINTAVAVRVNGHRLGFYAPAESGVPEVHLDAAVLDAARAGSADLGAGAKLAAYQRGYELDLADGTKVWALSVGSWGINLLVLPSAALRASGVGLIARIPEGAGLQLPAPADGSRLPIPINRHERYHDLYEVLAPGWRVTSTKSLFDYTSGKTTDSYAVAGFPPEAVPETIADLPPAAVSTARTTCSAVTDPDLADQCAYDVAVTGSPEYVALYAETDALQTQGTASLDQPPPGSSPSATPSGGTGGSAIGVTLVDDHVVGIGGHVLAPDGTLYVGVDEAGQSSGTSTAVLLAVDSATGKIKARAVGADHGVLAWTNGSLWAGEFKRRDANDCEVSRLDPATLAVQANVPTICSGNTAFAAVGDAIWFVDTTGADASGTGGHLRRIDAATNKVDPSPSGNLVAPFVTGNFALSREASVFASTSDGLIFGDRDHGLFLFTTGGGSFAPLGVPGRGSLWYPTGRGVWTQTESSIFGLGEGVASFFTGGSAAEQQVGINGNLVGADATSVYAASLIQDVAQSQELWRYPIDRSAPQRILVSGTVPDGSGGQQSLVYVDYSIPLIVTDRQVVKLWLVASPTQSGQKALMLQSAPLP